MTGGSVAATARPGLRSPSVRYVGRTVDVEDLVGGMEISERLNLKSKEAFRSWRRRFPDFPQPVAELGIGRVWAWPDIEEWARAAGRPRGYRNCAR